MSFFKQPLMQHFTQFKEDFLSLIALSFVANLLMLAPTIYMLQLYDRVMLSRNSLTLLTVTLLIAIFILVMALAEWLRSIIVIKAGVKFDQSLNRIIFNLAFERIFAGQKNTQEAMQDLTNIRQFLTSNGLFAFLDMPWAVIYIVVLFILNVSLGWLAIVFCLVQFGLGVWNHHSTEKPIKASMNANRINQQFLASKVRNLETLHVMGILPRLYQRWQSVQVTAHQLTQTSLDVQNRNQHINKFVRYTMQSLMLAAAALLAVKGEISIGSMIASNVLIARALQPFDMIVSTWKQYIETKNAMQRLNALLIAPTEIVVEDQLPQQVSTAYGEFQDNFKRGIVLKNLSVTLAPTQKQVLSHINLTIESGKILTIMGPSGSGKTTLARCLVGVIPVAHSSIVIDGVSIEKINSQQLADDIGYLPQDVELIEGTIAENIARFQTLNSTEIIAAAKLVGMHEVILRLPLGYDTKIDDSGLSLSGGQRQLIGLARTMYLTPQILVLDEPNAHLDEYGESNLLNAINTLKKMGKTIVVISHRTNILNVSDQLLVLKQGEIAHFGTTMQVLMALKQTKPVPQAA
ncbi:MAG TPA: type I secretion system permease/ATPase [Methylotenera sp.]|nr:type I secretion system permease/ATPase [Methylotenera sp.]HPH08546.1 type I secretion system permease/ATPase [Methylotenera sp.]HPM48680.1 type I secretion system permease/ATPase [Methylotenera sp.]